MEMDNDGGSSSFTSQIDDLPPEVLMKILNYLNSSQLFTCRLVNFRWNEISTHLLQDNFEKQKSSFKSSKTKFNPTLRLKFDGESSKYVCQNATDSQERKHKTVEEVIEFFSLSSSSTTTTTTTFRHLPFIFSRIHMDDIEHFEEEKMTKFLSKFGSSFKSLGLILNVNSCVTVRKLWGYLNAFATNIEQVEIKSRGSLLRPFPLFDLEKIPIINNMDKNQVPFIKKIQRLKVRVNLSQRNDKEYLKFILHIIKHAPLLQKIEPVDPLNIFLVNDLHLLWEMEMKMQISLVALIKKLKISEVPESTLNLMTLDLFKNIQLQSLTLEYNYYLARGEERINNFINNIFKHNKKSLTSLNVGVRIFPDVMTSIEILPQSYFRDVILPHVRHINIDVLCLLTCQQQQQESQSQPTTTNKGNLLQQIGQSCPNVAHLNLFSLMTNFIQIAPALWTHFRGLKSFTLKICMNTPDFNYDALDSIFSGYSVESIWRIKERVKASNNDNNNIMSIEEARREEEQNPSILNLTDLSYLSLQFCTGRNDPVFKEKLAKEIRTLLFVQILPQHLRENPTSVEIVDDENRNNTTTNSTPLFTLHLHELDPLS